MRYYNKADLHYFVKPGQSLTLQIEAIHFDSTPYAIEGHTKAKRFRAIIAQPFHLRNKTLKAKIEPGDWARFTYLGLDEREFPDFLVERLAKSQPDRQLGLELQP